MFFFDAGVEVIQKKMFSGWWELGGCQCWVWEVLSVGEAGCGRGNGTGRILGGCHLASWLRLLVTVADQRRHDSELQILARDCFQTSSTWG